MPRPRVALREEIDRVAVLVGRKEARKILAWYGVVRKNKKESEPVQKARARGDWKSG